MKNRTMLLLAAAAVLMCTACGSDDRKADEGNVPVENSEADTSGEKEALPASQDYVSSDQTYQVTLLEGLTQTDMQLQAGTTMMGLDGGSELSGFSCVSVGGPKTGIPGNPEGIETLEDYADYIADMALDGSGVTVSWESADAAATEGADQCLAREGRAKSGTGSGQAYAYYAEAAGCYYSVIIVGNDGDVESARQVLALTFLDGTGAEDTTVDFINGMSAVLDSVNGINVRETFRMLEETGTEESQLEDLASQARMSLSSNWGVENAEDLAETVDWLMKEGHNQDALQFLEEYGGTKETDRSAFDAKLKEQGLSEGMYTGLMAAYDAYTAYGEGAIAAWDLSRVGTVMGFGYASGYCSYEEAMDTLLEAAEKSKSLFGSWEDFNQSYLYGYSYWAEESLDDPDSSAAERASIVESMSAQANGPFSVDWNMELKKEW